MGENEPYGPHEGEGWDPSKASDVKELFEMIASERPAFVTGSPSFHSVFSTELAQRETQSTLSGRSDKQSRCCMLQWTSARNRFVQDAAFCMSIPWEASSWLDLRMVALQKTEGVFTVSLPMCCFKAKIER